MILSAVVEVILRVIPPSRVPWTGSLGDCGWLAVRAVIATAAARQGQLQP